MIVLKTTSWKYDWEFYQFNLKNQPETLSVRLDRENSSIQFNLRTILISARFVLSSKMGADNFRSLNLLFRFKIKHVSEPLTKREINRDE